MSERVKENYIQYMKKNCQKLWMDEDCLRVILQENYITAGNIGAYLDEAERLGKPELTKALLEYRDKNFSREALEREEQKTKDKAENEPSAAELKKIWSTKKREDKTLIITSYKGTDLQVTVPKQIGKSPVTAIGGTAFTPELLHANNRRVRMFITEITLPDSITLIEGSAFDYCGSHCDSLTSVHIPAKTVEFRGNPFSEIKNHLTIYAPKGSTAEQLVEEWQERYYTAEKNGWPHIDKSVQWIAFEPEEGSQS